jgi:hypothetical protein
MMTMALESKRRIEPSARRIGDAVRTTTALTTLPFLTAAVGMESRTDGIADVGGDDVTNTGGAAAFAEHANHFCAAGAGVVGDGKHGFHLDHGREELEI